ncbi:unnamed protein product [Ectocarpus sp. 13 AM-2016]
MLFRWVFVVVFAKRVEIIAGCATNIFYAVVSLVCSRRGDPFSLELIARLAKTRAACHAFLSWVALFAGRSFSRRDSLRLLSSRCALHLCGWVAEVKAFLRACGAPCSRKSKDTTGPAWKPQHHIHTPGT